MKSTHRNFKNFPRKLQYGWSGILGCTSSCKIAIQELKKVQMLMKALDVVIKRKKRLKVLLIMWNIGDMVEHNVSFIPVLAFIICTNIPDV